MENTALILYHMEDLQKERQFVNLCRRLNIRTRALKSSDSSREVGALAGIRLSGVKASKPHEQVPEGYKMPELLIFSGVSDEALDHFLKEYRAEGLAPVALKAVLTPYNLTWTVYELAVELMKERMAMLMSRRS